MTHSNTIDNWLTKEKCKTCAVKNILDTIVEYISGKLQDYFDGVDKRIRFPLYAVSNTMRDIERIQEGKKPKFPPQYNAEKTPD